MSSRTPTHKYLRCSPIVCDICGRTLGSARVFCMDCHGNTTVDFCSEPECLRSTAMVTKGFRDDLTMPHTLSHSMLKVHRILFDRDIGQVVKNAKDALEVARKTLSGLKARREPMPQCAYCKQTVSQPCWYCVDCTGEFLNVDIVLIITPVDIRPCRR